MKRNIDTIRIDFTLNGVKTSCSVNSSVLLLDLIRDQLGLTGTKPGCLEGECGACSILVDGAAVNSCMYPAVNVHGKKLVTIEGLGEKGKQDQVQDALVKHGAVQCGFCTSGMAITIKSMQLKTGKMKLKYSRENIKKGLEGNLCRCTGYVKIIDAAEEVINSK